MRFVETDPTYALLIHIEEHFGNHFSFLNVDNKYEYISAQPLSQLFAYVCNVCYQYIYNNPLSRPIGQTFASDSSAESCVSSGSSAGNTSHE